nr:putative ribonuclease H-like domain-containing protein [Tanacetum cinerariifolium]
TGSGKLYCQWELSSNSGNALCILFPTSPTKPDKDLSQSNRPTTPIIEDWVSDSEDESETEPSQHDFSFVQPTEQVKTPRPSVKPVEHPIPAANHKTSIPKPKTHGNNRNIKACFVLLTRSKLVPPTVARPVTTVVPQPHVTRPRLAKTVVPMPHSPPRRNINHRPSPKPCRFTPKVTTVKAPKINVVKGVHGNWDIIPSGDLTCLFAKATVDKSNLWHKRLCHINLKTMNKLVKGNIVRGLPSKVFENNHTCVACKKGKQHRASCKTKPINSVRQPLQRLHMDLFGPTFVKILNKKSYYLVVIDDYSRFTWVFFLANKDETSPILKTFITGIENQLSLKVKIIRSDNGTKFKNHDLNQFCGIKGIKREFSVPRTPQQNGITKRKNRTLIEDARTMLADSLLPITFWVEAVNTACYVQNKVLVTKPHNKTPYELLLGRTPSIGFMRPFGCHVTILNTLDPLGKFYRKANEGFLVGYSNTDGDATFEVKEPEFEGRKPESEVYVSQSSSAKTKKHDDKTKREAKGKTTQTRSMTRMVKDQGGLTQINNEDFHTCLFTCFLSQEEPKRVHQALKDPSWIEAMQEELLQFKMQKVWVLVDLPNGKRPIEEVFAQVARIEAIRLFLAYASFMGFMVYQMDVKSAFLYGTIKEEVYVCQPSGFEDPNYPDKVYVVDIIFGSTNKDLYKAFEKLMKDKFQMSSMGELTFFLDLQVKQKPDVIFISHDKYVAKILRKFSLTDGKSASTPIDTEKPLLKDPNVAYSDSDYAGASLDRKSTTGGCQFLGCRLISWQYKKQTVVATLSTEDEYVAAASCCAQVLWIQNQLLDYRKKVIITEATVREALRLGDVESIDCLPNEEIFIELARMGYEKPSTKLTFSVICLSTSRKFNFSKYIFDSLVRNVDSSSKFYMYLRFLQLMIRAQVSDLSSHTTKYSSPALIQKVFANMRRVGKRFFGVETPLFEGMIVAQQTDDVADEVATGVDVDDVPAADVEPTLPSPTLVTAAAATITVPAPITAATITAAPSAARRRKGVVIRDPKETATPSTIIHSEPKSKDKGKGIMVQEPKPLKKQAQIEQDEAYARDIEEEATDRSPSQKNMMVYLKNMAGFKMDYFKGMSYDDIHPIFEKYFNSNVAFLEKSKEKLEEEESRALKRKTKSHEEKAVKKQKLDEEVDDLKKHLQIVLNDDDDVYTEATPLALKAPIVKDRFASSNPKNFLDDFLQTTLTYMFEKPDVEAQVWKSQRGIQDDFAGREKISIDKVHFGLDAEQSLELMLLKTSRIYSKGLLLLVKGLLLLMQINAVG